MALIKKIGLLIVCGVAIASAAYFRGTKTYRPEDLFKTITLERRTLAQKVTASGTLFPREQISIGSLATGRVEKWYVDDNDPIKKDQLLVKIYDGIGDANVKKFTGTLEDKKALSTYQEASFKRQEALYRYGQISLDAYQQAVRNRAVAAADVKAAEGDLSVAQQAYESLFIKSPDDGVVIARKIDVGQMVASVFNATELYTIAKDLTLLEARLDVDEASVGMVKDGHEAEFVVDAYPTESFKTAVKIVKYLSKVVGTVVTFQTVLNIDNHDLRLRPGMTTDVDIYIGKASDALSLPNKAFRMNAKGLKEIAQKLGYEYHRLDLTVGKKKIDTLWVLKDKSFVQTVVKLGLNDGKYTQVLDGIDEKTTIIIDSNEAAQENEVIKNMFGKSGIGK